MLSRKTSIRLELLQLLGGKKYPVHNLIPLLLLSSKLSGYKRQSVVNTLQQLKKEKLIRTGSDAVMLSPQGRAYLQKQSDRLHFFTSPFQKNSPKNLLVLFDIPENKKVEREWFRKQLREFGYEMIQKSVWLGPSPLPAEFVKYVHAIGLADTIKTFKLASNQHIPSL